MTDENEILPLKKKPNEFTSVLSLTGPIDNGHLSKNPKIENYPTIDECSQMIGLLERKRDYYNLILQPGEYTRLVDDALASITKAKMYLDSLTNNFNHAPQALVDTEKELSHAKARRQELINHQAQQTRERTGGRVSVGSTTDKTAKKLTKLRSVMGDETVDKLLLVLGSEQAVVDALKGV